MRHLFLLLNLEPAQKKVIAKILFINLTYYHNKIIINTKLNKF